MAREISSYDPGVAYSHLSTRGNYPLTISEYTRRASDVTRKILTDSGKRKIADGVSISDLVDGDFTLEMIPFRPTEQEVQPFNIHTKNK